MADGHVFRALRYWIILLYFYVCFSGALLPKTNPDLDISGDTLLFISHGLTTVKIQHFNHRSPSSQHAKNLQLPNSRLLLLGCRFTINSSLSLLLIRLANDVELQPGPVGSSSSHDILSDLRDLSTKNGLKIIHQNIRGLVANKDSLCQMIDDSKHIDIISLSETHLSDSEEAQVQLDGYTFINRPRKTGKGGGVGVYISSSVPFHRRLDLERDGIECIWIEILFPKSKGILIGFIYRPPSSSKHLCADFENKLESMLSAVSSENKECILTGDINCNYLVSSDNKELKAMLLSFGLKQLIKDPTRVTQDSKTLLDVIYTNRPQNVYSVKTIPAGLSDHDMIGCVRKLHNHKFQPRTITCRNYANYDPISFCNDLRSNSLTPVFKSSCVNEAWSFLKAILKKCIDKHAPAIKKRIKGKLCPWLTQKVKQEMNTKDQLLRKARKTNREIDWSSYKRQRNKVNGMVKNCKSRYHRELLEETVGSPNKFWSAIKKLYPTKSTKEPGAAFLVNGAVETDKEVIANSFCKFFTDVAGSLKRKIFPLCNFVWKRPLTIDTQQPLENFEFRSVSDKVVFNALKSLKRNKSSGLDNFPSGMLKDSADIIAKPLTHIINLSLATGSIPTDWKAAKIVPLFKSGSMAEIDNYRPISILPSMSKILEKVVFKQLMAHFEQNGLLSHFQYGFRRMRSTELAVTHLTDVIRREGENGNLTGCVFIDLSKAFDTISHSGLLSKLSTYGVRGTELAWFTDYLFCRSQVVQYKGVLSEPQPILTGVPQGSILGPILFIIFFNDVHKPLQHSKIITYADDSVIYTSSKDIDTIQRSLSEDMNNLCEWFKDNELIINLKKDKTESMLFGTAKRINLQDKELKLSVNGTLINNTSTYKYLGVHLDSSLNLASHFDRIYKKAATRINLLRSIRPLIDQKCAESIYNTMIAPIFTYCGTLGLSFPDYRKEMIKNIERRGFKVIGNSSFNPPSVNNLIKRKSCLFVFDCLLNNVCTPFKNYFERLVHSKATRNNGISVKLPKVRLEFGKKSFYYQGAKTFNNLPAELRSLDSRLKFKNKLRDYFS